MDISEGLKILASSSADGAGLHHTLGMEFFSTPDPDSFMARMPVDKRHIQAAGYINGGASIAFAETAAGLGTLSLRPESPSFGMSVTCSHIRPIPEGGYVTATVTVIHKGHKSHIWRVDIKDQENRLAATVNVTNYIFEREG